MISHCAAVIMSDRTSEERKGLLWLTVAGLSVHCVREGRGAWLLVDDGGGCGRGCSHKGPGNREDRIRVAARTTQDPPKTRPYDSLPRPPKDSSTSPKQLHQLGTSVQHMNFWETLRT